MTEKQKVCVGTIIRETRSELLQEAIDVFGKGVRGLQSDRMSNRMGA